MGGVWEKQTRSARTMLSSLLKTHDTSLNDESQSTLLNEVKGIVNSYPLTTDLLSDVNSMIPLRLINLFTLKSRKVMPPPVAFTALDNFSHRHWRQGCSASPMSFGVDAENKLLQHFSVNKNGSPNQWQI